MAKKLIDRALERAGMPTEAAGESEYKEKYGSISGSRIAVSKSAGKLWKSRRDQALSARRSSGIIDAWEDAIAYYKNDQTAGRRATDGQSSRNAHIANRPNSRFSETENLVFSNTNSLVPALFARNPTVEITPVEAMPSDESSAYYRMLERLANALATRKTLPGINLKPFIRRCVVMCQLTNRAIIEVGYTQKTDSTEETLVEIGELSAKLKDAKSTKEIEEIEGQLESLEDQVDALRPSGPWIKFRHPNSVLIDTNSDQPDRSDAKWMMVCEYVSTQFIRARFGEKDANGSYKSIYQPTHVMKLNSSGQNSAEEDVNSFSLIVDDADYKAHGYDDEDSYNHAKMTKVWYVWDTITRRMLMYNDKDWTWPIWVWDDVHHLDQFFPFYFLEMYTDPEDNDARGEVTYYLDQQDAINEINDEARRARNWARRNVVYNSRVVQDRTVIEKLVKGVDDTAIGLDVDPEIDINKIITTVVPPSTQFAKLFDKTDKYAAIDRISSSNEIARGGQFKTNTTNEAIAKYQEVSNVRLDEKIEAIEDFIGSIMWGIIQLCLQFMSQDVVASLVGTEDARLWRNMQPEEIRSTLSMHVQGGSTQKPTSRAKKQEAIEVGQVLGQFARVTPAAVIVALQVMERAFDEVVIKSEDWQAIRASLQQPETQQPAGAPDAQAMASKLPPQAQQALQSAVSKGVPLEEALPRIVNTLQQQGGMQ